MYLPILDNLEGTLVVDSRLIAERLNIEHESLMESLETHRTKAEQAFGIFRFETGKIQQGSGRGRPEKYALLNEDQATFAMTLSRNTPEVVDCKIALVSSFSKAKKKIKEYEEKQTEYRAIKACVLPEPKTWRRMFSEEFWTKMYWGGL